jgi:excisionase family DNA binding protein
METHLDANQSVIAQPKLLDIESAARALGVGRSTVYSEIRAKRLSVVKIGRRTLIRVDDIDRYIVGLAAQP